MRKLMLLLPLFMFAATIGARADSVNMTLTSAGGPGGYNADSGMTYPYDFTVKDTTTGTTSFNVALICDDYVNEVVVGESWNATSQSLSQAAGGQGQMTVNTALFSDDGGAAGVPSTFTTQQAYYVAGYLAQELFSYGSGVTAGESEAINVAIWDLFGSSNAAFLNSPSASENTYSLGAISGVLTAGNYSPLQLIDQAYIATGNGKNDLSPNIVVYTPLLSNLNIQNGCSAPACNPPQEYLGEVPEPGSLLLLGTGLLGMVGLMRRKSSRKA